MLARLAPLALALVACAPSPEPRDAAPDRRISRPDAAPDVEEPRFEDVFFPTLDAPNEASAPDSESDATAPDDGAPLPDSSPDARPDAGTDARRDAAPDACAPTEQFCTGRCIDVTNDPANCGWCGRVCPSGGSPAFVCRFGQCVLPDESAVMACVGGTGRCRRGAICATPPATCSCVAFSVDTAQCGITRETDCFNLRWDPRHCGACNNACASGARCINGVCLP